MPLTIRLTLRYARYDVGLAIAMLSRRDDLFLPAWSEDQLDSLSSSSIKAPYFDDTLDAWVLSRHVDILAAFRASSLSPVSPREQADFCKMRRREHTYCLRSHLESRPFGRTDTCVA
jgi:hypothetical protein